MSMEPKRRMVRVISIAVVVILIGGGLAAEMLKTTPVQTSKATQGTIRQYVEERARTTLPHVYHLTMPEQGRIRAITFKEGAPVQQGEIVATIEKADLKDAMTSCNEMVEATLNSYNASLAQIKSAQTSKEFNEWLWGAQKTLYEKKQTSELEKKKAQKDFLESEVSLEAAQQTAYAMKAFYAMTKLMPIYVNRRLKRTDILSPIEGIILQRYVWNEKVMQPGDSLIDIGNLDNLQVTADILTEEAVTISDGDAVEIYGETIGANPIHGTVQRIKPKGFTKTSSLGVEQQRVPVVIDFEARDLQALKTAGRSLGLEYRVRVRVFTDEATNAVIIPRTALFRGNDGSWQAYVVRKGKTELVTLEIGIVNNKNAEVKHGISEGDEVVIAPESSLKAGVRVSST